ncbi:hypothetical protein BBJ28_00013870 [Nothophytophthora sp. Chile5]|nr:hypothetical protein BBJ28_00013870 [Nothophytophthora sp. Chile5]
MTLGGSDSLGLQGSLTQIAWLTLTLRLRPVLTDSDAGAKQCNSDTFGGNPPDWDHQNHSSNIIPQHALAPNSAIPQFASNAPPPAAANHVGPLVGAAHGHLRGAAAPEQRCVARLAPHRARLDRRADIGEGGVRWVFVQNVPEEMLEIVDLAALLHDIDDWKYQSATEKPTKRAVEFLQAQNVATDKIERVMAIIDSMGFKEELGGSGADAIGAIGIARCFTFGGHKMRPLYDPAVPPNDGMTKEQYMDPNRPNTTINHFYEVRLFFAFQTVAPPTRAATIPMSMSMLLQKLLKLRGMMKTNAGRRMAEERHAFMETFLDQFHKEISGRG